MQNNTVATETAPTSTEVAPEGYISKRDIMLAALEEGKERGWCSELKDVLKKRFGIVVPERPTDVALRVTVEIPASHLNSAYGDNWLNFDPANPDDISLNTTESYYGMTVAEMATFAALTSIYNNASDSYYRDRHQGAKTVVKSAKIEMIRTTPDATADSE